MNTAEPSLQNYWMPFTDNRDFKSEPRYLVRAEGVHYWDHRNHKLLDGCSGLFCTPAGHCRKEIVAAVHSQLRKLDYAPSFQTTHPIAAQFAERVASLTPEPLKEVFFVNSGSEAVDTAMKIALAYHRALGQGQRIRFVSRERAYHGVNMGGTSLSGMVNNRRQFGPGLPGVVHLRHTWSPSSRYTQGQPADGAELADDLLRLANIYGPETIAACFVEPIAGSTGALVPPKGYLPRLREICDQFGILLVFDEVITGFGRTGQPFAADTFGVVPDMITMAKALTNGSLPMGAVAVRQELYNTIVDRSPGGSVEFFHGYTYSAHPAACAAGLAAMDIFRDEDLFNRAKELSDYFLDGLFSLKDISIVTDIRGFGMLGGVDVESDGQPGHRGLQVQKALFHGGLHIKSTGDCLILAPQFVAEKEHIDQMIDILRNTLKGC